MLWREGCPHLASSASADRKQLEQWQQHRMGLVRAVPAIDIAKNESVMMYISHDSGSVTLQPPDPVDAIVPGGMHSPVECDSAPCSQGHIADFSRLNAFVRSIDRRE
jgi:hypothetical protein